MKIGWGVIGVGRFVKRFMGPAILRSDSSRFVGIFSRSTEKAKDFAEEFGVEYTYNSLEKMLNNPEIDVIYIASPNNLHTTQTIQVAESGKHVFCEKPMALTEQECEAMINACEKNNVKLGLNFQNRYHPAHIMARDYIKSNKIGKLFVAKAQYCHGSMKGRWQGWRNDPAATGAGALVGTGLHPIDLLRFLLDSEIKKVRSLVVNKTKYHQVDEMVYLILEFENGVDATLISGILAPRSDNDAVFYGNNAKIICKDTIGYAREIEGQLIVEGDPLNINKKFPFDMIGLCAESINNFNKCIFENTHPDKGMSGNNGLQMVKITNAIIKSSKENRTIEIK
jgi:predicted dehydrogenase